MTANAPLKRDLPRPIVLIVLDGWGIGRDEPGNAILAARTNSELVTNNRAPATMKSSAVQFTSLVNCIAINGTRRISPVASAIHPKTLFCATMSVRLVLMITPWVALRRVHARSSL